MSLPVIFSQATNQPLGKPEIHFSLMMARKIKHALPASEEAFGQRLARLRKASRLSQEQLAQHLGTTQTLISEYEHDNRRVHAECISKIAHLLHVRVSLATILDGDSVSGDQVW
jgi:ribosome-binding protein aMBF1 (putative translation factor)